MLTVSHCHSLTQSLVLLTLNCISATRFVVDGEKGSDANDGRNPSHPFRTVQHCVSSLTDPGDSCNIREGRYHESVTVNGLRGSSKNPFVIRGFENERPVLDGTVPIEPERWNFDEATGICSAAIEEDIFALFLDDQLLTAARWPNALWSDKTVFNNSFWGKCDEASEFGNIVDDGSQGLAESGINATGAMAILNIGSFNTYVREVLQHEPGRASFSYNHDMGDVHWVAKHNQYYLEASLALLDNPGEWFYDLETKILHLIPPTGSCQDVSSKSLRGRTIDYSLTITNTTGLTIANMTFLASTINAYSVDQEESHIDEITLDSLSLRFQSSSRRMLRSQEVPNWTRLMAFASIGHGDSVFGRLAVLNCTFEGGEGSALEYAGQDSLIENNLFLYNDWTGHDNGNGGTVLSQSHSIGDHFRQNSLLYNGRSAGVRLGYRATIELNEVVGQCEGEIQSDGSAIQVQPARQEEASIHHNWLHDSPKSAVRFDDGPHLGVNGYQGFNVAWNTGSLMVKGDNHSSRNNLALGRPRDDGKCSLCVLYKFRHNPVIWNNHSIVLNNGALRADGGTNVDEKPESRWPLAGMVLENNLSDLEISEYLVSVEMRDFRPVPGGLLTMGPEVIGAYMPGLSSTYWIPGRKEDKATSPIPPVGATVSADRDALMFRGGFLSHQHHLYLGLDMEEVMLANTSSPLLVARMKGEENMVAVELEADKTYFWKVDSYSYSGDVWTFYTSKSSSVCFEG